MRRKAENMKKAIPDLKILAFVCDPIKRLYSHIKMHWANERKRKSFWGNLRKFKNRFLISIRRLQTVFLRMQALMFAEGTSQILKKIRT